MMGSPSLRGREWPRFLSAPDPQLLLELYVPGLAASVRYDRCCAYFSSTSLQAAAMGFGKLIETLESLGPKAAKPAIRLLVNEELHAEDIRALTERGDAKPLEKHLGKRFKNPTEALQRQRLEMLGWLVKQGLLEVRVGVMRTTGGILHAKFGCMYDAKGNGLVFRGSGNESASGILANYELIEVSPSWQDKAAAEHYQQEFQRLWDGTHPSVLTVALPDAIRDKLIKLAPKTVPTREPYTDTARQRAAMVWRWMAEAPYMEFGGEVCDTTAMVQMWPHQRHVVSETSEAWPEGRLLCDEVGMGKTLEAILVLRRLLAGRGVRRALILVPAGLTRQWQSELREKGGIVVPRLEGEDLVWPDKREQKRVGLAKALEQPLLLISRETARTPANLEALLNAPLWDIVVLDEAHAARRASTGEGDFNSANLLLGMIRELQVRGQARSFLFLSATPMQTMPWEPWDMLQPLGEGGPWIAEFADIEKYYEGIVQTESGEITEDLALHCASMVACDPTFPPHAKHPEWAEPNKLVDAMLYGEDATRAEIGHWLRKGSPLARRLHRNTRSTLRAYHRLDLLDRPPAARRVNDGEWDFRDDRERDVYRAVETYIDQRWAAMEDEKKGKGFVMTIYKRRAASSLAALRRSLQRRLDLVERYIASLAADDPTRFDLPEDFDAADLPEDLQKELPSSAPSTMKEATDERGQLQRFIRELEELGGQDSKLRAFVEVLDTITSDGRPCLVFTEYTDTMAYLRDQLLPRYSSAKTLATYSGEGGAWYDGIAWVHLTKDEVTRKLRAGELQMVICTDAASEGLNLQAAAALVNYDLPWNPSKVEQRIGRIDRIGQEQTEIRIVNMFLRNSVDDLVYRRLRLRCGMFEHFVGRMQPVLSAAKKLLLSHSSDVSQLEAAILSADKNVLSKETYVDEEAVPSAAPRQRLTANAMVSALEMLREVKGATLSLSHDGGSCSLVLPAMKRVRLGLTDRALEHDLELIPLNPSNKTMRDVADSLGKAMEGLPLVLGSVERGAFRASSAYWIAGGQEVNVESADQLIALVTEWDGSAVHPVTRHTVRQAASALAEARVMGMEEAARQRSAERDERQKRAAGFRLSLAIARTLAAQNDSSSLQGIHNRMFELMDRQGSAGEILKQAYEKLGTYPTLPAHHGPRVAEYIERLTKAKRDGAASLTMVVAALADPRWRL
jgi:hypothetical protein